MSILTNYFRRNQAAGMAVRGVIFFAVIILLNRGFGFSIDQIAQFIGKVVLAVLYMGFIAAIFMAIVLELFRSKDNAS